MTEPLDYGRPAKRKRHRLYLAWVIGGVAGLVVGFAIDMIRQEILLRHNALLGHSEEGIIYILPPAAILGAAVASFFVRRRR